MTDVLVVSGEPLWPAVHGGRIRTARIVEQLARKLAVTVAAPVEDDAPLDVDVVPLPPLGRDRGPLVRTPRLGQALLEPERLAVVRDAVAARHPASVLYAASYLAAVVPPLGVPEVVDYPDVQVRRLASLARAGNVRSRAANAVEATKARRWEPAVARRARLCAAVTDADLAVLRSWGAEAVLVRHGADPCEYTPSPADGPVTFVASFGYPPNDQAARFLLDRVWPLLHRAEPRLRLRIVGRRADSLLVPAGIEVVADPADVDRSYREASLVLAPVRTGGGAQLKVTEALARGRLVVATPFSAGSAPAAGVGVVVAAGVLEHVGAIGLWWRDAPARWAQEQRLVAASPVPTWEDACAPLLEALSL